MLCLANVTLAAVNAKFSAGRCRSVYGEIQFFSPARGWPNHASFSPRRLKVDCVLNDIVLPLNGVPAEIIQRVDGSPTAEGR